MKHAQGRILARVFLYVCMDMSAHNHFLALFDVDSLLKR